MNDTAPADGDVLIHDHEVPSLLEIPRQPSLWTLWLCKTGAVAAADVAPDGLAHRLRPAITSWIAGSTFIEARSRLPKQAVRHPTLPLVACPDIVIPVQNSRYGTGPGVALVEPMNPGAWHRNWKGNRLQPEVTPAPMARIQSILATHDLQWGIVIPVVGYNNPYPPIVVKRDQELIDAIAAAAGRFVQLVRDGTPPAPNGRGDRKALAAIARLSPAPAAATRELSPEHKELVRSYQENAGAIHQRRKQLQTQLASDEEPLRQAEAKIAEVLVSYGGRALIDGTEVALHVPDRQLAPAPTDVTVRIGDTNGAAVHPH